MRRASTSAGGTSLGGRWRVRIGNRRRSALWWRLPLVLVAWAIAAAPIVAGIYAIATLRSYAAGLPAIPDLDGWKGELPQTSTIHAHDGTILAELPFQDGEVIGHREWLPIERMPLRMVQALVAAEDVRFLQHQGVDFKAIVRAAWTNYQAGRVVEGASTITQQIARSLLPDAIGSQQTARRKVREALVARRLERHYSKARLLETYANLVFLGAGSYGVVAAARAYFDKPVSDLSWAEAALLAGLAQAPGRANPYVNREAALARRNDVLDRILEAGFMTAEEHRVARTTAIELRRTTERYGTMAPWYTERARQLVAEQVPGDYSRGGLVIETAADPALESQLVPLVVSHTGRLADGDAVPQAGAALLDHRTRYVVAQLGGRSWHESRFDRSDQACRQPGSAFKPIVYAAALEAGAITPGTALRDAPVAEYDEQADVHWKPRNSGRSFRGLVLAQDALALSLNAPAIDVLDRVGGARVIATARKLGVTTDLDDVRPLVLGSSCVVPAQLAGVYAAFARGGITMEPIHVVRIRRGAEVLVDRASPYDPWLDPARRIDRMAAHALARRSATSAIDPITAYQIRSMLADVVRRGTATLARQLGRPAAGKTGTTNDNTDAWFVGFTDRLVAAVWVGHDDPQTTLGPRQDGGRAALPLWIQLVRAAESSRPPGEVVGSPPEGMVSRRVSRDSGLLARPGEGGALELWFRRGSEPSQAEDGALGVPSDLSRATRDF